MSELLLEFLCEELPLWAQRIGGRELNERITTQLKELGFWQEQTAARDFVTPRRLCLTIKGLASEIPPRQERRRGPRKNAPEKAVEGFCKSVGIKRALLKEEGDYLYAILKSPGEKLGDTLARIIPEEAGKIGWQKSMRWGDGEVRFPRPLRSMLCLVDGNVVDFKIAGIRSGALTYGHRFMSPDAFKVKGFADYEKKLSSNKVILDSQRRIDRIVLESEKLAAQQKVRLNKNEPLLAEIAALSEYPVPVLCSIDKEYTGLSDEVLREVIEGQQKYLTICKKDSDALAPFCIAVADIETNDAGAIVRRGNERVLRARLADADFFYKRDLEKWKQKDAHENLLQELESITFYGQVTMREKVRKTEEVAMVLFDSFFPLKFTDEKINNYLPSVKKNMADLIGEMVRYAKLDLVSEVVREFPRLQGATGSEYVSRIGVSEKNKRYKEYIAAAIKEQYQPKGLEDSIPKTKLGQCLSLADKLVSLGILWEYGDARPSGSGDPHGLRRAALGVIRILIEGEISYPMSDSQRGLRRACGNPNFAKLLFLFFIDRMKIYLRHRKNLRPDVVDAVLFHPADVWRNKVNPGQDGFIGFHFDDLLGIYRRAETLAVYFPGTREGKAVLKGYKRAANILRDKPFEALVFAPIEEDLLRERAERCLYESIIVAEDNIKNSINDNQYKKAVEYCARLCSPIDDFFEQVRVDVEDEELRENRIKLLCKTWYALHNVADFSKISDE
ncbi:MAG: glycine--tRNA ligase subunit beta [Hyphomicrobiales bacterium]|nr:glycine--tRNA ligase subunit beta [Hyphomicrobiales bacterium]